ncbi:PQQ-binding-like beta-propeller repeat protein [Streptomyces sp. NPDC051217]|uniref:serine/threonine-protein kinase n=1 Tax=Streptomyces sp. NPDC051217 TaxID=3365644 RepID=UPI00378D8EE8
MALRVVGGRYELVDFVGRGGMGEVWEGRDRLIERRVAVKLLPHDRRDASGAELFFREARTAGGLSHTGVVTVFDLGQDPDDGTLYLVMEFVTGRGLDTVLREDGAAQIRTAVDWMAQTAAALQAAHTAGVVHRDLKPANLMATPDDQIKILDFGIARYIAATHKSSKVIGTLAYMPPERFGDHPTDPRSDLYSLGCVLHELLTGSTPFQAAEAVAMLAAHLYKAPEPPGRARPGVPAALDDLVMALLAKDPDDRPSSAGEVCERLRELSTSASAPGAGSHVSDADTETGTTPFAAAGPDPARTPEPARVPRPAAGTPPRGRRISRRTALRLGIGAGGAAAVATGVVAAVNLFDDRGTPGPDTADPRVRWRHSVGGAVTSSPAVADGLVYVGGSDGRVYALDATTGERKWHYPTIDKLEPAPTVADGAVYIGGSSAVTSLDAATGKKRWAVSRDSGLKPPAVVDGVVYIAGYKYMSALDAATGAEEWAVGSSDWGFRNKSVWSNEPEDWGFTSPRVVDGVVYIGSSKRVYALDAATGDMKWAFDSGDWVRSSPTVADKVVYVGSNSKRVYALDAADGNKNWSYATGDKVRSSPAVANGVVYVSSSDHSVYALETAIKDSPA